MSDNNQYEEICHMCRRSEQNAGKMFHLPNGICVCEDCMKKTMSAMSRFGFAPMPEMSHDELQTLIDGAQAFQMPQSPDGMPDFLQAAQNGEGGGGETVEPDPEDAQKKPKQSPFGNGFPNISFLNMGDLQGLMGGGQKVKRRKPDEEKVPIIDIKDIPQPHKLKEMLDEYVVGQEHAKKVISVAVYNHYKRLAAECMKDEEFPDSLKSVEIEKSNMLMIGPTGCGKTYLVRTLAKLLNVPLAIADATSLTEAGYIGDDIESVVSKLLAAADNDVDRAECGIIFVDEIDKLAKKPNSNHRDVSGESVQQGMLKLLEGAEIEVPIGATSKNAMVPMTTVNTRNILFICGGAFPDLEEIIKSRLSKQAGIGFNSELKDKYDKDKTLLHKVTTEDIKKYGMIPEFVGRLPIICPLDSLDEDALVAILKEPKNAILKQYQKLLELDEVKLIFDDSALRAIAKKAKEKDTGARALRAIIEEFMLDIMYEIPKDDNIGTVTITGDYIEGKGGPIVEIRS